MPFDPNLAVHYPLLTAMLAPALFLTATGSLLLNANNRLARISDRLRMEIDRAQSPDPSAQPLAARIDMLRRRAHTVLLALRLLHLALCSFVATSLGVGLNALLPVQFEILPSALAVLGVTLLLGGSIQLWREANLAVRSLELTMSEYELLKPGITTDKR